MVFGHALHTQRQHHRQDGGQALGHSRHRQRHAEQQHVNDIGGAANLGDEQDGCHHHDRDDHDRQAQRAPDTCNFFFQRRRLLDSRFQQRRDSAHLGFHADGRDDRAARALRHSRALEDHVELVCQRHRCGQRGGGLEHGFTFAGKGRFLHAQAQSSKQARVGTHGIALRQIDHVAAHQLGTGHALRLAISQHSCRGRCHLGQCRHCVLRLGFLQQTDHGVQQHHRGDDDRIHRPARASSHRAFNPPRHQRDGHRRHQQVDERILKLSQHAPPCGHPGSGTQFVGTILCTPTLGFRRAEPGFDIHLQRLGHRAGGHDRRIVDGLETTRKVAGDFQHRHVRAFEFDLNHRHVDKGQA